MFAPIAFTNSPKIISKYRKKGYDSFDSSKNAANEIVVFEPEQIHILGSNKDIQGFKDFVGQLAQQTDDLPTSNTVDLGMDIMDFLKQLTPDQRKFYNELFQNEQLTVKCRKV